MSKILAIVRPTVHLLKDEQGNTIRSDYMYPSAPSCHVDVISWNKDLNPPEGDFLQEQMWSVEGPEDGLEVFFADPRVIQVTEKECCDLCCEWDTPKEIEDPMVRPGAKILCPDCGDELSCPGCGPLEGKTPKMTRHHRGWDRTDHEHHFMGVEQVTEEDLDIKHQHRKTDHMVAAGKKVAMNKASVGNILGEG